jgi:hypothetical protein
MTESRAYPGAVAKEAHARDVDVARGSRLPTRIDDSATVGSDGSHQLDGDIRALLAFP